MNGLDRDDKVFVAKLIGGGCLSLIALLILGPVITFGLGYFGGWILSLFVGDLVANGLNLIFDTTRFTAQVVPLSCAIFATIGRYFKSSNTNTNSAS